MDVSKYSSGMSSRRYPAEFKQFKQEALAHAEMPVGHPSADDVFAKAWEDGHAYGLDSVVDLLVDLVELVKPEIWVELQALKGGTHE